MCNDGFGAIYRSTILNNNLKIWPVLADYTLKGILYRFCTVKGWDNDANFHNLSLIPLSFFV